MKELAPFTAACLQSRNTSPAVRINATITYGFLKIVCEVSLKQIETFACLPCNADAITSAYLDQS